MNRMCRLPPLAALQFHTYTWFGENLEDQLTAYAAQGTPTGNAGIQRRIRRQPHNLGRRIAASLYPFSGWVFWSWESAYRTGGDWHRDPLC